MPETPRHFINFCRHCGHAVEYRIPDDGDTRVRAVCPSCNTIHYVNPLNVVGTIPVYQDKVLLCKRNIEPRKGKWTLPAGYMELDETLPEGAARETMEEAGIAFEMQSLFSIVSLPDAGQVHFFYLAKMLNDSINPGPETQEAQLFDEASIPWEELAFKTSRQTLERFFADRKKNHFGLHDFSIQ